MRSYAARAAAFNARESLVAQRAAGIKGLDARIAAFNKELATIDASLEQLNQSCNRSLR